jgi:hypothetical protein
MAAGAIILLVMGVIILLGFLIGIINHKIMAKQEDDVPDMAARKIAPADGPRDLEEADGFRPGQVPVTHGQKVRIRGLVQEPQFNGQCGIVLEWDKNAGRWLVILNDGSQKLLRPVSLEPDPNAVQDLRALGARAGLAISSPTDEPPLWAWSATISTSAAPQPGVLSLDDAIADELRVQEEREKNDKLYTEDRDPTPKAEILSEQRGF